MEKRQALVISVDGGARELFLVPVLSIEGTTPIVWQTLQVQGYIVCFCSNVLSKPLQIGMQKGNQPTRSRDLVGQ